MADLLVIITSAYLIGLGGGFVDGVDPSLDVADIVGP